MARFTRQKYLHPVNTRKHIADVQGTTAVDTQLNITLAQGLDNPVIANVAECTTGSYVRSLFLNVQAATTSTGALANIYMIVWKNPSNAITMVNANLQGASDLKKLIFHTEMLMIEKNTTGIPRTLFKGVLKIPKHMQRLGPDDTIIIQLFTPGVTMEFCIQCIYKEIR